MILKREEITKNHEVKLESGETIEEVREEGCKYLGTMERNKMNEYKMKEIYRKEYLRRT